MLKKFPIRLKFIFLYALMSVCTIFIYVVVNFAFNAIIDNQTTTYNVYMEGETAAITIEASLARQAAYAGAATLSTGAARTQALAAFAAEDTAIQENLALLSSLSAGDATATGLVDAVTQQYTTACQPLASAFTTAVSGANQAAIDTAYQALTPQLAALAAPLEQLAAHYDAAADTAIVASASIPGKMIVFYIVYTALYVVCVYLLCHRLVRATAIPMQMMEKAAQSIAEGDISVSVQYEANDEVGRLAAALQRMIASISQQAQVLSVMAEGDYTPDIPVRSPKDVVNTAIHKMLVNNNTVFSQIRTAAHEVSAGAEQISQGAQGLAAGSTQQAASIDQFSNNIDTILDKAQATATSTSSALALTQQSATLMQQGVTSMQQLREAMDSIDESAKNITRVNKVIDDIAFQTNILALNAAVEAARAGQHGKGFAVVADEVRNLAAKSAAAAQETSALVAGSSQRVQEGGKIAEQASADMSAVAELSDQNQALIQDIASQAQTQAEAMSELSLGIGQITQVVQANSATAEESAASAEEMSAQASLLSETVQRFRLKGTPATPTPKHEIPATLLPADDFSGDPLF